MRKSGIRFKITEINIVYFLCITALIFFYASDAGNKILQYYAYTNAEAHQEQKSISIYVRALFEIFFLIISIVFINRKRLNLLILLIFLFIVFIVGQVTYYLNSSFEFNIGENILIFNKYIFIFLVYSGIYKIINDREKLNKLILILENIFVLNSILIFIGLIFNINLFKSYYSQYFRYGYDGLIPAINEASLFYIIAVGYFYYKKYILHEKSYKFYIVFIASLLLGSKAIIIFNVFLLIHHLFSGANRKQIINSVLILSGTIFLFFLFITSQLGKKVFGVFFYIVKKQGILTMLLTGRDYSLKIRLAKNIEYWNVINYLFGGQDQTRFLIEMDIVDLFLFFGFWGVVIYFYLLFKSIFNFQHFLKFTYFFIFMYLFIGFLGGHFLASAINSLYLVLFCLFQKYHNAFLTENYKKIEK